MHDAKAAILALAADDDLVPLKGIEGGFIRLLSIAQADAVAAGGEDANYLFLIAAVCDETGKPLFNDADLPRLRKIKAAKFQSLLSQCLAFNNASAEAEGAAAKN